MSNIDVALLSEIWSSSVEGDFCKEELIDSVLKDGGHDMSDLSKEDLMALLEGRFHGDWSEPAFAFSELLSYYAACAKELNSQQIVGWVLASFIIADTIEQGATQWESQFNVFIKGFIAIRDRLEIDQSIQILQRVFCKSQSRIPDGTPDL